MHYIAQQKSSSSAWGVSMESSVLATTLKSTAAAHYATITYFMLSLAQKNKRRPPAATGVLDVSIGYATATCTTHSRSHKSAKHRLN